MCSRFCKTHSASCICAFVVLHVILAVTLAMALFTRYYVYQPGIHLDMPDDMRIVHKEVSSIFCSSHIIDSSLLDTTTDTTRRGKNIDSNILPEFDVYLFDENPADGNMTRVKKQFSVQGSGMQLSHGMREYHSFNFLEDSHIEVFICTQYSWDVQKMVTNQGNASNITGLFVYFIKGQHMLDSYLSKVAKHPDVPPCVGNDCAKYINVKPSPGCYTVNNAGNGSYLNAVAEEADEYFILYVNVDYTKKNLVSLIKYRTNRTEYDLSKYSPAATDIDKYRVSPNKYVLLYFKYVQDLTVFHMYNIKVDYMCESNTMVYISIFFFTPLALIIILGVVLMCCQDKYEPVPHTPRGLVEPAADRERGLMDADSSRAYGSHDVIYS